MTTYLNTLFRRYVRRGLLIDSNILLLLLVGSFDISNIKKFNRTRQFAEEDYGLLMRMIDPFDRVYTTPNILTEVSNLAGHFSHNLRFEFFSHFGRSLIKFDEQYVECINISSDPNFPKFGLTDSIIAYCARDMGILVLTDDFPLFNYLNSQGLDAINFNHIRTSVWV